MESEMTAKFRRLLFMSQQRDQLQAALEDDSLSEKARKKIHDSYLKATVMLACEVVEMTK